MRAGRALVGLVALLMLAQPLLVLAPAAQAGDGGDGGTSRAGSVLTVTEEYVVREGQEWDQVLVTGTGVLRVLDGAALVTGRVTLSEGSQLHIAGGTLGVWAEGDPKDGRVTGWADVIVISDGGLLMVEGPQGTASATRGDDSVVDLRVARSLRITDSQVLVRGGDGHSPDAPAGRGDLASDQYAGGAASLRIVVDPAGSGMTVTSSSIQVIGGRGGDAPHGRPSKGDLGGAAGGFSAGGNVTGTVGSGGDARLELDASTIDLVSSVLEVIGGDGGDAGDGAPAGAGAGGGGGGFSGADGAGTDGPAGDGGNVSGHVASGGASTALLSTDGLTQLDTLVSATGGSGGNAGDGGDCDPSRPDTVLSGGGGGGYSGGGGGAAGPSPHTDGGRGGTVNGSVGAGGDARVTVNAQASLLHSSQLLSTAGSGGRGGSAGTGTRGPGDWEWRAGGGGGAYSAGGGGGTTPGTWSSGTGGTAGRVTGRVGAGGSASVELEVQNATVPANNTLRAIPGRGGDCWRSDAPGTPGGQGEGQITADGHHREHIPMCRVELLSPDHGDVRSSVPVFRWGDAVNSSFAGRAVKYEFEMDNLPTFASPEMRVVTSSNFLDPAWMPNFTNYWRVRALYERPWEEPGPWSHPRNITYINMPPVIGPVPRFDVMVSQVTTLDLSPYISDPDDPLGRLSVSADQEGVQGGPRLNLTFFFTEELGTIIVHFNVSDGLNEVMGQLLVRVTRYKHPPFIVGLTNHRPPLSLRVYEGTSAWFDILVHDVDSTEFTYWTEGDWEGAEAFPNGTLRVRGERGDVGVHDFKLHVADEGGREAVLRVEVRVINVNDPPDPPSIISPKRRVTVGVGEMVSFTALVSDPDLRYGQVLNVTFVSNDTGVMRAVQTTTTASVSSSSLPVGEHVVTVVVFDGQYSSSDQVVVVVEAPPEPPPISTPGSSGPPMWVFVVASLVLFAVGFTAGHVQLRRRTGEDEEGLNLP